MQGTASLARNKHLYNVLGLADFSSIDEVRAAYKGLALKYHPDKTLGDPILTEKYKEIKLVYELLSNEEQKKQYDTSLRLFHAYTHVHVNGERGLGTAGSGNVRTRSSYATSRGNAYNTNSTASAFAAPGPTPRSARMATEDSTRRANGAADGASAAADHRPSVSTAAFGAAPHTKHNTTNSTMSYEELYRQRYPYAFTSTPSNLNTTTGSGNGVGTSEAYNATTATSNTNGFTSNNSYASAGAAYSARGPGEHVGPAASPTAAGAVPLGTNYSPNNNNTTAAGSSSTPTASHYTAEQQELFRRREKERRAELKRQLDKEREARRAEERAAARRAQEKRQELLQRRWFEQQQAFSAAQRSSRTRTGSNTSHRRRFTSHSTPNGKRTLSSSNVTSGSSPPFPSSPLFASGNTGCTTTSSNGTAAANVYTGFMRGIPISTTTSSNTTTTAGDAMRVPELNLSNLARQLHRMNIHAARTARVIPTTSTVNTTTTPNARQNTLNTGRQGRRTASTTSTSTPPLPHDDINSGGVMAGKMRTTPYTALRRTSSSVVFSTTNTPTTTPTSMTTATTPTARQAASNGSNGLHVSNNTTYTNNNTSAKEVNGDKNAPERVRRTQTARTGSTSARDYVLPQDETVVEEDHEDCKGQQEREYSTKTSQHAAQTQQQTSSQSGPVYSPTNSTTAATATPPSETFIVNVQAGTNSELTGSTKAALPRRVARSATATSRVSVLIDASTINTNSTQEKMKKEKRHSEGNGESNNYSACHTTDRSHVNTTATSTTTTMNSTSTRSTRHRTRTQTSRAASRHSASRDKAHTQSSSQPSESPERLLALLQEDEQIERKQLIGAEEAQAWARLVRSAHQFTEQSLLQRVVLPEEAKARVQLVEESRIGRDRLNMIAAELHARASLMRTEAQQRRQMAGSAAHDYYFALQRGDGTSRMAFIERYRMARMPAGTTPTTTTTMANSNSTNSEGGLLLSKKSQSKASHKANTEPFMYNDNSPSPVLPHRNAPILSNEVKLSGPLYSQLIAREASARLALTQVEDADILALLHWQANARHRRYSAEKAAAVRQTVLRHQQQVRDLQDQIQALQNKLAHYEVTTTNTNGVSEMSNHAAVSFVNSQRPTQKARDNNTVTTAAAVVAGKEKVHSSSDSSLAFSIHSA